MQGVLNLVWDKLLPAMQPVPLAADAAAQTQLQQTLAGLTLHAQLGSAAPGVAAKWAGRRFAFPANSQKIESVSLEFGAADGAVTLVTRCNGVDQRIVCGNGEWTKGRMTYADLPEQPVAVSGAWTEDGTYTVRLSFYETPFRLTLGLKFTEDRLLYDSEYNVAFGPPKEPQLTGTPE